MMEHKKMRFGTLTIISSLLLFSAGIRVLGVSSAAFALDIPANAEAERITDAESVDEPPALEQLLDSFKVREAKLVEDEAHISERFEALQRAENKITAKLKEFADSESRLRELLAIADIAAEDDIAKLTSVYETMKPKAAATVFEEMPPAFAAGFLSRMAPPSAASVMANLNPQTAYAISVVFAGRHAEQPTK